MTSYGIGLYGDDALYGAEPSLNAKYQTASQTISAKPSVLVSHNEMSDGFAVSGTWDWKHTYLGEEVFTMQVTIRFTVPTLHLTYPT